MARFVSSGDAAVDKALQAVQATIPDASLFDGARQLSVSLTAATQKRLSHGLKRKYRGFILVGLSAPAIVTDDLTKSDTDSFLYLTASVDADVRVVVY